MTANNRPQPTSNWPFLLRQLVKRDLQSRYRGSLFGLMWMLGTPLLMLAVYSVVFGVLLKVKWGTELAQSSIPFAVTLYSGLVFHTVLGEILPRSVSLIRAHPNYVKRVVFPVGLLPVMATISAFSQLLIQLGLLFAACLWFGVSPSVHWLGVGLLLAPFLLLCLAFSYLLAAIGLFLPDLGQVMGLFVTILLFFSPIFYPVEQLPDLWQSLLYLNPLTYLVEAARAMLFTHQWLDWYGYALYSAVSLLALLIARLLFTRLQPFFADYL